MIGTLAEKVIEGIRSQSWEVIGRGGTWAEAMRPLEIYIQRKVERAVKAEREACAKVVEHFDGYSPRYANHLTNCAAAIRARSKE